MKTYKQVTVEKLSKIYCDMCGLCCTDDNFGNECAVLEASWGYNSLKDGTKYDIQLCEQCFDETLQFIKNRRKQYLGIFKYPYEHDPLNPEK